MAPRDHRTTPAERTLHRSAEEMNLAYAVIKMFTDFGRVAEKPLAPSAVEEMSTFWGRIQQLVVSKELSIALAKRCVVGAAQEARRLSAADARIGGDHVREAISVVRARSTATAGVLCRPPGT